MDHKKQAQLVQEDPSRTQLSSLVENLPISKPTLIATVVANFVLLVFGMFGGELKPIVGGVWEGFSMTVVGAYFIKSGGEHLINVRARRLEKRKEECIDDHVAEEE